MQSAASQQCDVLELRTMMQSDRPPCIVDVREKWEWDICHIANSMHIPMSELAQRIESLPRDCDIVVMCHHGVRSLNAAAMIRMNGFPRAVSLIGGINAWSDQIDPGVKKY